MLIAHALQYMSVYLLSTMNPTRGIIKQVHQAFAKFFWYKTGGERGKHWVARKDLCFPKIERGVGFEITP